MNLEFSLATFTKNILTQFTHIHIVQTQLLLTFVKNMICLVPDA